MNDLCKAIFTMLIYDKPLYNISVNFKKLSLTCLFVYAKIYTDLKWREGWRRGARNVFSHLCLCVKGGPETHPQIYAKEFGELFFPYPTQMPTRNKTRLLNSLPLEVRGREPRTKPATEGFVGPRLVRGMAVS
jgi:hypothetical protein